MTTKAAPNAPSGTPIAPGFRPSRNTRWAGALIVFLALVLAGVELAFPPLVMWRGWRTYNTENLNLSGVLTWKMALDADGRVWIQSLRDVFVMDVSGEWVRAVPPPDLFTGFGMLEVPAVYDSLGQKWTAVTTSYTSHTSAGPQWFTREDSGLAVQLADGTEARYTTANSGLTSNWIDYLYIDSRDVVWVGNIWHEVNSFDTRAALSAQRYARLTRVKTVMEWGTVAVLGLLFTAWAAAMTRQPAQWLAWFGVAVVGWTIFWRGGAEAVDMFGGHFGCIAIPGFFTFLGVGGALTGAGQLPAMGRWLRSPKRWLAASILTWMAVGLGLVFARERPWLAHLAAGAAAGVVAGLVQLPSLPGTVPRSGWWIPTVAISVSLMCLIGGAYSPGDYWRLNQVPIIAGAAIAATIMGVGFIWLAAGGAPTPVKAGAGVTSG